MTDDQEVKTGSGPVEEVSNFEFKIFNSMIPMFKGHQAELRKFIDSAELYFEALNEGGQDDFERFIMLKLDTNIYNWCQNKGINTWEEIKENLKQKYKTASNLPLLQKELFNIRQERRESVGQFSDKIEKKLFEMNEAARSEIEEFDVGRYKHYHEKLALRAFQDGLKDSLRLYIKARNYETLSEAITEARNEEGYTDNGGNDQEKSKDITCYRCGKKGHVRTQCYVRLSDQNGPRSFNTRPNVASRNDERRGEFYRPNISGNMFQNNRNGNNTGGYRSQDNGNFDRNWSQNTNQRRVNFEERPGPSNIRIAEVRNKSKNGNTRVGLNRSPTL